MKKCIFDSSINCKHYIDGEYRCFIFMQKCKDLKYDMVSGTNQYGLVSLTFREKGEKGRRIKDMALTYEITELGKKEVGDPKSVYFENIPKNTLKKMEDAIDKVLKEGDKKFDRKSYS